MLGSPSFGRDEFGTQGVGEPRYDFVLHVKEVSKRLIKALGPEMVAGFGVDQLHVNAKPFAAPLQRALQYIADIQLASQPLYIHGFAFERERGVARNHERAIDARKVRGQAFSYAIDEILLFWVTAQVG